MGKIIWTLEEEQIIRQFYRHEGGKGVHKRIPYRTASSIGDKARRMGIQFYKSKSSHKPWSTKELEILRQFYPIEGRDCYKRLPNRTKHAIQIHARHEGLAKSGPLPWYQEEINILR